MNNSKIILSKRYHIPLLVAISTALILSCVQLFVNTPMLLLERFLKGGGWIEIALVTVYASIVGYKMQQNNKQAEWRLKIWIIFSIVFFSQLILGLIGFDKFLMTGKLHLPIPMMILGGAVFRAEISFMPVLFISTVILSGPAWCSQLCYFGAWDAFMAGKQTYKSARLKLAAHLKLSVLFIIITTAVILRLFMVKPLYATIIAASFGIAGFLIIIFISPARGKMFHCIYYCPIGTLVNYLKYINPFRFRIDNNCIACMKCIPVCKYDALSAENIKKKKPGITCTMCGDCMQVCKPGSFYYKFPGLGPAVSRSLYLVITITLHAVFLALARI